MRDHERPLLSSTASVRIYNSRANSCPQLPSERPRFSYKDTPGACVGSRQGATEERWAGSCRPCSKSGRGVEDITLAWDSKAQLGQIGKPRKVQIGETKTRIKIEGDRVRRIANNVQVPRYSEQEPCQTRPAIREQLDFLQLTPTSCRLWLWSAPAGRPSVLHGPYPQQLSAISFPTCTAY